MSRRRERSGQPLGAWFHSSHPSLRDGFAPFHQAPNGWGC
jgi:hypothetical protein